jgi:hypothetical protein
MSKELGIQFNNIQIPPEGMERNPWSYASSPGYVDANKIKNLVVDTITISPDGYIKSGKEDFTDSTNAGYYISSEGVYIGSASDATKFKYDIEEETFEFVGKITATTGSSVSVNYLDGAITPSNLDIASAGWTTSCVFSATDYNTVAWTSGQVRTAKGTTYSISSGNTGNMSSATYIYLDINTSTTVLQKTTTASNAVGAGKILIAVAKNVSSPKKAEFQSFGNIGVGTLITADNIAANTITANELTSNSVTAAKIDVSQLSAISANIGSVTSGTITGALIQTSSSSNAGIKMSSTIGGMSIYGENIKIFDTSGTEYGSIGSGGAYFDIYAKSSRNIRITPGATSGTVFINVGSGAGIAPATSGTGNCGLSSQYWANVYSNNYNFSTSYMNYENSGITTHTHFKPSSARSYNCGASSYMWKNVYSDAYQVTRSGSTTRYITMNSSGNLEINTGLYVGGTLSKSAGSFTIDHPLKPDTHYLQHSFVESPDMLNIYRGNGQIVDGECKIEMPDWFSSLNGEIQDDYSYQLTSIGQQNDLWVKEEMSNGKVTFAGEKDGKFSYIITAIRHDDYAKKNRIQVELEKDSEKKQEYKDKIKNKK